MNTSVLIINVADSSYPRHKRMICYLKAIGLEVTVVPAPVWSGPRAIGFLVRAALLLSRSVRAGYRYDVVMLSEFSLHYAPVSWVVAKLNRAIHVVDGFIGLNETYVEDLGKYSSDSVVGKSILLLDWFAYYSADIFLVDTDMRADVLARRYQNLDTTVLSLPVGAPAWALPIGNKSVSVRDLKVLYYGNFIPLHGLDTLVEALALAIKQSNIQCLFVGNGRTYSSVVAQVNDLGIQSACTFREPVQEVELAALINAHDVVLGVFGESSKAKSVIANKVWQGLSCGSLVVTQQSPALSEISPLIDGQLVQVEPCNAANIALELTKLAAQKFNDSLLPRRQHTHRILETYVQKCYEQFGHLLLAKSNLARKRRFTLSREGGAVR